MEITLKKPKVENLKVNIGDNSYNIPLGAALSIDDYTLLDSFEGTVEFYARYIPKEVLNALSFAEINQLTKAWADETQKQSKVSLGE